MRPHPDCGDLDPEAHAGDPVGDGRYRVVVSAVAHPELDDWVREQAAQEAGRSGLVLGDYIGREAMLGESRPPDLYCHVFSAWRTGVPSDG